MLVEDRPRPSRRLVKIPYAASDPASLGMEIAASPQLSSPNAAASPAIAPIRERNQTIAGSSFLELICNLRRERIDGNRHRRLPAQLRASATQLLCLRHFGGSDPTAQVEKLPIAAAPKHLTRDPNQVLARYSLCSTFAPCSQQSEQPDLIRPGSDSEARRVGVSEATKSPATPYLLGRVTAPSWVRRATTRGGISRSLRLPATASPKVGAKRRTQLGGRKAQPSKSV